MIHQAAHGFIEVICGSMFSGKTEELVRRIRRASIARQKVQVFNPAIDTRYGTDHIQSHDASKIPSISISDPKEILECIDDNTRVVGIDEVQFFDQSIVEVANKLAYRGIRVILAGLDMDFKGKPFGPIPKLLAIAEHVTKLTAICTVCGEPATRSQRICQSGKNKNDQILIGAHELYEARCRIHHERDAHGIPAHQMGLVHRVIAPVRKKALGHEK